MERPRDTKALWLQHQQLQRSQPRYREHESKELSANGQKLRFVKSTLGNAPPNGFPLYIALHGGGGCPSSINDQQWYHMQRYYKSSVRDGVYVAPRGISDTWDLHFRPETYILLERLIENMILFENVDSNRVYLLGYSAGGDGVYQITPRLAQRFAAVNMSAGHSNNVDLTNVMHVPFCIQMGENDTAYGRHEDAAASGQKLDVLTAGAPQGTYAHEIFIHAGKQHNVRDEEMSRQFQLVLASPSLWLTSTNRWICEKIWQNTNAVDWVSRHSRNPLPRHLVWDLSTRVSPPTHLPRLSRTLPRMPSASVWAWTWARLATQAVWYWLDIGNETRESLGIEKIVASLDPARNAIVIRQAKRYLRIRLNERMLDLDRDVRVLVDDQELDVKVLPNARIQKQSLWQTNDPQLIFSTAITLTENGGRWDAASP